MAAIDSAAVMLQLQAATALWLRTISTKFEGEIGLHNFINLTMEVPKECFFPCPIKSPVTFCSNGELIKGLEVSAPILWTRECEYGRLSFQHYQNTANVLRIHISWLEQALALAMASLYNAGHKLSDMIKKPVQTLAGIEKVDWL